MISETEVRLELAATIAVVLILPFYMGWLHVALEGAVIYCLAAGLGMAAGERVHSAPSAWRLEFLLPDIALWAAAVMGAGGLAYLVALLFF